jgi:type I restriction enzyme S subunit
VTAPTAFKEVQLEEVTDLIQYGYTARSSGDLKGPKYLRITDIQNDDVDWDSVPHVTMDSCEFQRYQLLPGEIVFARSGATVGKSFLIEQDPPANAVFASYLIRVRCQRAVLNPEYAAYFFRSEDYWRQIREGSAGTGQPNFNGTKLAGLRIPLPPLDQQHLIVSKLRSMFSRTKIACEELARICPLAERYKRMILLSAFRGDLTTDWRRSHPNDRADFLDAQGVHQIPSDELPPLPEGWSWVLAGGLCDVKSGIALGKRRSPGTALIQRPYLRVANVQRGWLDLEEIKTIAVTRTRGSSPVSSTWRCFDE